MTPNKQLPSATLARWVLVAGLQRHLLRTGAPRLLMFVLVLVTGLAGLSASVCLMDFQVRNMALRYAISVAVAYGAFLALVWLWITFHQRRWSRIAKAGSRPEFNGSQVEERPYSEPATEDRRTWAESLEFFLEADGLVVLALVVAGVISIVFVIWHVISSIAFAPEFAAEVFLDGVFSAALYRRLSRIEHRHWLKSAFAKTGPAFLWTLLFFTFGGVVSRHYAPEAVSIGGVIRHLTVPIR